MRNFSIENTKLLNRGHEMDEYASQIKKDRVYYLIGEKNTIQDFYSRMSKYINLNITFNQNDDSVIESIKNGSAAIICTDYERHEYEKNKIKCIGIGAVLNNTFFQGEVFEEVYRVYFLNKIFLDRIEIFLTPCCTLNCEKCVSYIPYFTNKDNTPLDILEKDADLLLSKVDYIKKIKLLGGEGFLYPYLGEYIQYIYDRYKDKIGSIRVGTNGTIFPNGNVLKICHECNVIADISDYRKAVPDKCKLEETKKYFEDHGVCTDIKRTGEQWLDMGFPNDIPPKRTEDEEQKHFNACAMFCRQFASGKMFYCCSNFAAVKAGLFESNSNDYFDFNNNFSKKELLEYELGFSLIGHTTFCEVCRGCSDESNDRHIDVAKQTAKNLYAKGYKI